MSSTTSDVVTKLSNLLPTGTFLAFQAMAPLFTNNGECGIVEKIMTGILILLFAMICWVLNFTDSFTLPNGSVYYGIVTRQGLYNPNFKNSNIAGVVGYFYPADKYVVNRFDFLNGVFDLIALGCLTMLTPPVSTCYYPNISNTVIKTLPILVAILVGCYFAIAPPPRQGVGFSSPAATPGQKVETVPENPVSEDSNKQLLLSPSSKEQGSWDTKITLASSPDHWSCTWSTCHGGAIY